MALEVIIVSGSGQEHAGCLLLTSEVLFVVSVSEDTQQQAFPITEVTNGQPPTALRRSTGTEPPSLKTVPGCSGRQSVDWCLVSLRQVECQQEPDEPNQLTLTLQQQTVSTEAEVSEGGRTLAHLHNTVVLEMTRRFEGFPSGATRGRRKNRGNKRIELRFNRC